MFQRYALAPLALAGALLGGTAAAFAQSPPPPAGAMPAMQGGPPMGHHHHRRHRGWRAALDGLALTPDQKSKIDTMMRADHASYRAAGDTQTPDARRAQREKMRADIESVLTPDQKTQFEATMKHHRRGPHVMASPSA